MSVMIKGSKRYRKAQEFVSADKMYTLQEAVEILRNMPHTQFDETVEVSLKLGADPKKSDQMIRSSVILPHGIGKKVRVIVFCEPEKEQEAKAAGADFVGGQDLIEKVVKENWLEFDSCISTPGMMRFVSKLGKLLGPRGLMPSPKTGTVTVDVTQAVNEAKSGKVEFRMDKLGGMAVGIGKISFSAQAIVENIQTFIDKLDGLRPPSVKGDLIKGFYISTTMSPSVRIKR